jgi:hypothetical protein
MRILQEPGSKPFSVSTAHWGRLKSSSTRRPITTDNQHNDVERLLTHLKWHRVVARCNSQILSELQGIVLNHRCADMSEPVQFRNTKILQSLTMSGSIFCSAQLPNEPLERRHRSVDLEQSQCERLRDTQCRHSWFPLQLPENPGASCHFVLQFPAVKMQKKILKHNKILI